jgi:cell division control protein 11
MDNHLELEEDGLKLSLTIIDTPGFGENINNEGGWVLRFLAMTDRNFVLTM